jgi:hypothetical protein
MRDHDDGLGWDHPSLGELTGYRILVVCLLCRHHTYLEPRELAKRYGTRGAWRLLTPKLRCTRCGMKRVEASAGEAASELERSYQLHHSL